MYVVHLALLALALALLLLRMVQLLRRHLNHGAFAAMVRKLVAAGNVERARKLCAAAPAATSVRVADAMLKALQQKAGKLALTDAYRAALQEALADLAAGAYRSYAAMILALATFAIPPDDLDLPVALSHYAPAGITLLACLQAFLYARRRDEVITVSDDLHSYLLASHP